MNVAPSEFPRIVGASSLSNPGFAILMAVSSARQAAQPTVRLLRSHATHQARTATLNMLRQILAGTGGAPEQKTPRVVRFLDLSDDVNSLPESMNYLFTRGFQPMLNPSDLETTASDRFPPDVETME